MTIKRRLFWSNILMIIVPVFSTALVGLFCAVFLWFFFVNGAGLNLSAQENFDRASAVIAETVERSLERGADFSDVLPTLENNGLTLRVLSEGQEVFAYGTMESEDAALLKAADLLDGKASIAQNGRRLYACREEIQGVAYRIYLLGGAYSKAEGFNRRAALCLSMLLVGLTVFFSIRLTNRFLTKFVFKKIEAPLDILANGVHEIRDGNLDYRIPYTEQDEFRPVCSDFNEMAVRLKQFVELTQKQEESRKALIAGISHDIRSPLTSIQAYVEGLLDGVAKTPEKQRQYLQTIKAKAENLAHIVSQLFLFSQMELGEYPENPRLLRLDHVIQETVAPTRADYEKQGLTIYMQLSPAAVYADPLQVRRIITNILENSLKYKDKEKGTVWIRLEQTKQGCCLIFLDDGPGVPKAALPHLFDVFYRSDPARQNPDKGSGLGLAIVANAVQRMGGAVQAFCGQPQGLGIRIDLPLGEQKHGKNIDC